MEDTNFGDRPDKLIAVFKRLDKGNTGKVPAETVLTLLRKFASDGGKDAFLTPDELTEFTTEAADGDAKGQIEYASFVKDVVFGKIS